MALIKPRLATWSEIVVGLVGVGVTQREIASERQKALAQFLAGADVALHVVADEQVSLGFASLRLISN